MYAFKPAHSVAPAIPGAPKAFMDLLAFEDLLREVDAQPEWRSRSQIAADYYDGKQLSAEVVSELNKRNQPAIVHNLIAPTIDGVLGMEARNRTGWRAVADDEGVEADAVAEAINHKISDYSRLAYADMAVSNAYAAQVKSGLGWVEVRKNHDPFGNNPYIFEYVHRREVFWDWSDQTPDLSTARWIMRRRFFDKDILTAYFPQHARLIEHAGSGWSRFHAALEDDEVSDSLLRAHNDWASSSRGGDYWYERQLRQIMLSLVYYRVLDTRPVLKLENGRALIFDPENEMHRAVAQAGRAVVVNAPFQKMRIAWFLGPHLLDDRPFIAPHNHWPLVPFFGFRADSDGAPYGLIERMIPAQDEVNFRRSKLTHLLNVRRIIMHSDATDMSIEDVKREVAKPDGVVILNPDAEAGKDAIRVENDFAVAQQQFQVMQDSMRMIQDTAGVYGAMLGQETNASSGTAMNTLIDQGATTLAELNDNYRFAKQRVGELLMAFIIDEIGEQQQKITPRDPLNGMRKKPITLNARQRLDDGHERISNDVLQTRLSVAIADVTTTQSYRQQMLDRFMTVVSSLPDELKVTMLPYMIELMDTPKKPEMLKAINEKLGIVDVDKMNEEERAAHEEKMKAQQGEEARAKDILIKEKMAEIDKLIAETEQLHAAAAEKSSRANLAGEDAKLKRSEIVENMTKVRKMVSEMQEMGLRRVDAEIESLQN